MKKGQSGNQSSGASATSGSAGQRALYTFLGYALLGPFLSGFVTLAALVLAGPLQLEGLIPAGLSNAGQAALSVFVWAAIPAALTGLVLALVVWRRGSFPWIAAAAAGGIAFMMAAIALRLPNELALTPLTGLAAFISMGVRQMLIGGRIIESE